MTHDAAFSSIPDVPWDKLPPDVAAALLLSGDGEDRLSRLAGRLLDSMGDSPDRDVVALFSDMALAAWECAPLSGRAASVVHQVHEQRPFLSGQAAVFSAACAALRPDDPGRADTLGAAIRAGNIESAKTLADAAAKAEPGNVFWLRFASYLGIHLGELDWYERWLAKLAMPGGFASVFLGDYAFGRGDYARAADLYARAFERTSLPGWLAREGECRLRLGDREAARACWAKVLALRPWQINTRLRLNDLERGADIPGPPPAGRGEILLYSWNHGPDLDKALAALAASDLGSCGLTVLNNGSTDATADVIRAWQRRFGPRMRTVMLPTNVGAPAARNWLLTLPSSKMADWVAFLDDDALVPPDWLGLFGTALRLSPDAGIVGCRVVDMAAPLTIQSADLHFEPEEAAGQPSEQPGDQSASAANAANVPGGNASRQGGRNVTDSHMNGPDFGQYSYLRRAVSVTGCCHLLTRKNIETVGLFDLRFSPSQFDDFERDLRSCAGGDYPLYQGHLRVRHIKRSGVIAGISPWQQANVNGNLVKLWGSYGPDVVRRIAEGDEKKFS